MAMWHQKGRKTGRLGAETPDLDAALLAWRKAPAAGAVERLSAETRSSILDATLERSQSDYAAERPLTPLFLPARRMMLVGFPVLALTLALGWLVRPAEIAAPVAADRFPPVHATKSGDEVIFLIANGQRPHAVYKSQAPNSFDAPPAFWTQDGSFRDRLDGGPALVFYRID
jgi:hypothetical protein